MLPVHTGMLSKIKVSSKALFLVVSAFQCGAECFSALILLFAQQDDPEFLRCIL